MNREEIIKKVHTRTYYLAESKKSEIPELAFMQTSEDNTDILNDYLDAAIDEMKAYMNKRLVSFEWEGDVITVESKRDKTDLMTQSLDKAMADYLVEETIYRWASDTFPKFADRELRDKKLDNLKDVVCSLAPIVRRRATTMGV